MINNKISVIIPVYNVEQYLRQCVDSVLKQTYHNLEVILVDDGATDSCPAICDEYARQDERIRVIHKTNGGLADARNAGLQIATGDYIGYVDSDDYIHQEMYERLLTACEEHQADIGICRFSIFSDALGDLIDYREVRTYNNREALEAYIDESVDELITPSAWSKLYKRKCVEGMQFPKGKLCEDIVYTAKAFYHANKVIYLDQELYFYRNRPGSIMNDSTVLARRIREEIEQYLDRIQFLQAVNEVELVKLCRYELYMRLQIRYTEAVHYHIQDVAQEILSLMNTCRQDTKEILKQRRGDMCSIDFIRKYLSVTSPRIYSTISQHRK